MEHEHEPVNSHMRYNQYTHGPNDSGSLPLLSTQSQRAGREGMVCRVVTCNLYGEILKQPKIHCRSAHGMTVEDNLNLPPFDPEKKKLPKYMKYRREERCFYPNCNQYGRLLRMLSKHVRRMHGLTYKEYVKLYGRNYSWKSRFRDPQEKDDELAIPYSYCGREAETESLASSFHSSNEMEDSLNASQNTPGICKSDPEMSSYSVQDNLQDHERAEPSNQFKSFDVEIQDSEDQGESKPALVHCAYCNQDYTMSNVKDHYNCHEGHAVKCQNGGCDRIVGLHDLEQHKKIECDFRLVNCRSCGNQIPFNCLQSHQTQNCKFRKVSCMNCGELVILSKMDEHLNLYCRKLTVECPLSFLGCKEKGTQHSLNAHIRENAYSHILRLCDEVKRLKNNSGNHSRPEPGKKTMKTFLWNIENFQQQLHSAKTGGTEILTSDSFSTGSNGYSMYLTLYPNGFLNGAGTHLSLYVHLKSGKYDSVLPWPFKQKIILTVLDQSNCSQANLQHVQIECIPDPVNREEDAEIFKKPNQAGNSQGWGKNKFMSQDQLLHGRYIKDGCIMVMARVEKYSYGDQLT